MPRLSTLFFLLALVSLGGCSTTLVQQLPAGDITTCDPAWPGLWKATSRDDDKPEFAWIEVSADCKQLTFTDAEKTSIEHKTLTRITTPAGDFVSVTDAEGKPECIGKDPRDCGFPIERYVREDDQIRLYAANHRAIHDAIASGEITGMTQIGNKDVEEGTKPKEPKRSGARKSATGAADLTYQNLITGSPEQIGQWFLERPALFDAEPWLVLDRQQADTRPKHAEVKK